MSAFSTIEIPGEMRQGTLSSRKKKFIGKVVLPEGPVTAFVPNTGNLDGVLEENSRVVIVERWARTRRLKYDLIAADVSGTWVVVDTRLANELVATNLAAKRLKGLSDFGAYEREKAIEGFRYDFLLHDGKTRILEVKSCTRAVGRAAKFPDTVSVRSTHQVEKMIDLLRKGYRCAILFVAMRPDVQRFEPDWDRDPVFAETLNSARNSGVQIAAVSTSFEPPSFGILKDIAVEFR